MRAGQEIYENSIKNQTILSKEWATSSRDEEEGVQIKIPETEDELLKGFNFYKSLKEQLVVPDEQHQPEQKWHPFKKQSSLDKIVEKFNAAKNCSDEYKKEGQSVVAEFDRFDDKDLLLLHTIVEVYQSRIKIQPKHELVKQENKP